MSSLRDRVRSITDRAGQRGSLVSIPTETIIIEDQGIPFIVHVTTLQERKSQAKTEQMESPFNPFLPPDPELLIGEVSPDHIAVLNKFNVLDHHLLIVSRRFEPQEALLTLDDFAALTACMHEMDGLGFYNSGTVAGASQPHKHLQLVPLPLARTSHQLSTADDALATKPGEESGLAHGPRPTPLDSVLDCSIEKGTITRVPTLPFVHSMIILDGSRIGEYRAVELHQLYRSACAAVGVHDETQPYNLLLTRRWMLVVPRSREDWRGMSINALGFAGSLLVRTSSELDQLQEVGPLAVLKSVV